MRRLTRLFLCLAVSVTLLAGCGFVTGTRGSGNVISENRNVSGFDTISLEGAGQLIVDQSGDEALTITADDNLLPLLTSEVVGSKLVLGVKGHEGVDPTKTIVYKVNAKNLVGLSIAGSGTVEAKRVHTESLKVDIAGSADTTVSGTSDRQDISVAGSGKYLAGEFKTKATSINIAGSGDAVLAASDSLNVTIAGSGSIKYIGDPKITQNVMGSGSISKE